MVPRLREKIYVAGGVSDISTAVEESRDYRIVIPPYDVSSPEYTAKCALLMRGALGEKFMAVVVSGRSINIAVDFFKEATTEYFPYLVFVDALPFVDKIITRLEWDDLLIPECIYLRASNSDTNPAAGEWYSIPDLPGGTRGSKSFEIDGSIQGG